MPIQLLNELDNMKYEDLKSKLRDKAAVRAIRLFKQEPNSFYKRYTIEAKPERPPADPETGRRKDGYQDVLKIVRIRDAMVLYEGRQFDKDDRTLEIFPDFRKDDRSYENVCTRIFVRIAKEENEDFDGLVVLFEKLFKASRGRMSQKSQKLLASETGHDRIDDQDEETKDGGEAEDGLGLAHPASPPTAVSGGPGPPVRAERYSVRHCRW